MKPTTARHRMLYVAPLHFASKQLAAPLSDELQEKYNQNSARVIEGDSVKVMRGEFKGIEGKVTTVSTEKRGIAIEGIKREKLKGGSVDIYIHPSNVMITTLNLEDKWRQSRLEGQKPKTVKSQQPQETKNVEKPKESTPTPEAVKPKEKSSNKKEPKLSEKPEKKTKQVKSSKPKGSDK